MCVSVSGTVDVLCVCVVLCMSSNVCSVCLDEMDSSDNTKTQLVALECGHQFHTMCIVKAFRYSPRCPMCRDTGIPHEAAADAVEADNQNQLTAAAVKEYEQRMTEYRQYMKEKREVVLTDSDARESAQRMAKVTGQLAAVRARIRPLMHEHGKVYRKIARLKANEHVLIQQLNTTQMAWRACLNRHGIQWWLRRPRRPVAMTVFSSSSS